MKCSSWWEKNDPDQSPQIGASLEPPEACRHTVPGHLPLSGVGLGLLRTGVPGGMLIHSSGSTLKAHRGSPTYVTPRASARPAPQGQGFGAEGLFPESFPDVENWSANSGLT